MSSRAVPSARSSSSSARSSATAVPPSSRERELGVRLRADVDVVGPEGHDGSVGERELERPARVEGAMDRTAVDRLERGRHERRALPELGSERSEVGHHRVGEQSLEIRDRLHELHVERARDLVRDLGRESLAVGEQHERAPEGLAHLGLGVAAGGETERDDRSRASHVGFENRIDGGAVGNGPVGEVDGLGGPRQVAVQHVGDERRIGGEQPCDRRERLVQGGVRDRVVRVPEARAGAPDVPVREIVDELLDRLRAAQRVELVEGGGHRVDGCVDARADPPVEDMGGGGRCVGRRPAVEVRVRDEERVGVPQGEEEPAGGLVDRVEGHAARGPRRARREEVPPQGVGAAGVEHRPWIDDVAFRLRHLLAVLVEDQCVADDIAVRRTAEHERVHGEQRVEPAAGLVDRLADEVGRKATLEDVLVLEGRVELRRGHGARVEPGVEDGLHPASSARLAGRAFEFDLVHGGAVEVEADQVAAGEVGELRHRADAGVVAAVVATPDREGRAPEAVP